jgi:hypothetical protein
MRNPLSQRKSMMKYILDVKIYGCTSYLSTQMDIHIMIIYICIPFFLIGQSEIRIACGDYLWQWIITKCALFREDLP